ncbi:hypothetical protein [Thalassoglobus sp.]|uniref:hypothetical protein n=1 Tax=Thalassoglobus sp. TaxID=2795869 RepID=UPI003AA7EDEE
MSAFRLKFSLKIVLVLALTCCVPQSTYAYDGLSDFLEDVFRGLTGQKRPAPMVREAQQFPPPPEKEMQARKERLESYAQAQKNWVEETCELTDEQIKKYDALIAEQVKTSQKTRLNANQQQRGFADYFPIRFITDGAATLQFEGNDWDLKVRDILTQPQNEKLEAAKRKRVDQLTLSQRDRVINLLDAELYFTTDQRKVIEEHLEGRLSRKRLKLYSLNPQNYYLQYESPVPLLSNLSDGALSEIQNKRLDHVRNNSSSGPNSEKYITFMSNLGVDGWYKLLDESTDSQKDRLTEMAEVRIHYFKNEFDLDEQQLRHLRIAAKGTVVYCMQDWKASTKRNLEQWEERMQQQQFGNGNFGFSVSTPSSSSVEQHQLWRNTLSEMGIDSRKDLTQRDQEERDARAEYLVTLLDYELWLTTEQREQFKKLLQKRLPKNEVQGYEYLYEVVQIAIPLARIEEKELTTILEPEQIQAWKTLKKQFGFNGRNVTINMQNQGQFSFHIPD